MTRETQAYIEARRSQGALKSVAHVHQTRSPDAVDVDSFVSQKGKGFGTNKGKSKGSRTVTAGTAGGKSGKVQEVECWNCGKNGHRASEDWCKPREQGKGAGARPQPGGGKSKGKGKGKTKNKGANSLEEQTEKDGALTGSFEMGIFEAQTKNPSPRVDVDG